MKFIVTVPVEISIEDALTFAGYKPERVQKCIASAIRDAGCATKELL